MDFDFGNLIYILLMIAFVIFGAKGKKKKAPIPVQTEEEDATPENAESPIVNKLSDNIKKYFGEQFDLDASSNEAEDEYEEDLEYDTQFDSYSDSGEYDEKIDDVYSTYDRIDEEKKVSNDYDFKAEEPKTEVRTEKKRRKKSTRAFTSQLLSEFDPKKALLYSEIFKPKYF